MTNPRTHVARHRSSSPTTSGLAPLIVPLLGLLSLSASACSTSALVSSDAPRQTVLLSEYSYGGATDAYVHVLDGRDLSSVARIAALDPHTDVQPVPGGERLLAAEGIGQAQPGCCGLYLLDLVAGTRCKLHAPLAAYVASADGVLGYSQRGNTPVSIFDLATGSRVGTLPSGADTFELSPSPDGRWLAAASRFSLDGQPALHFFDAQTHRRAGSTTRDLRALTWQDGLLYGLTRADGEWHLQSLRPPDGRLITDRALGELGIQVPDDAQLDLASTGEVLIAHVMFSDWMRFQSRGQVGADAPGGLFVLGADHGAAARHLVPEHDIGEVATSQDGWWLYALIASSHAPRLLAIETDTGRVEAELDLGDLGPGRWSVSAAELDAHALAVTDDRVLGPCPHAQAESAP